MSRKTSFICMAPYFFKMNAHFWYAAPHVRPYHFMSIRCLSNTVAMVTFTWFLSKIIANLIDKICYSASRMNYPTLKNSQKLWFLTLFKCVLLKYRAKCCNVPFVSRGPKWAASWQNQENGMNAQHRLRSAWASTQSDQSLCYLHEESLGP